jgi:chromate transport protein ChrA
MKTWQSLGYLGLVPFVICIIFFESYPHHFLFNSQQIFHFYSVIILCFLAGTLWKKDSKKLQSNVQIVSNVLCIYAFICLFLPVYYALIFLPLGYLALLIAEYLFCDKEQMSYTQPYFNMRLILTLFVCALHAFALIAWF